MDSRSVVIVAVIAACCSGTYTGASFAQQKAPQADVSAQLIQHLPEDWRPIATRYHVFSDWAYHNYPRRNDDELRFEAFSQLEGAAGAEEFVAAHLDEELASKFDKPEQRVELIDLITVRPNWTNNPLAISLLAREANNPNDPEVSLTAVNALRVLVARRLEAGVVPSLERFTFPGDYWKGYREGNKEWGDQLEAADQKLLYIGDEITLPEFLRMPPPLFQVPTKSDTIRVAMMGDFGTRGEDQHKVAAAMAGEDHKKPFDFGITLGDNFYFDLKGPDDPGFKVAFEDLYGPMNITFYPVFGNHDWWGETPEIELLYSYKNPHWHFPAPYYTYTAGPVQFFAINTEDTEDGEGIRTHLISALQSLWLQSELDKSTAKWKVVYTHFPIFDSLKTYSSLADDLMPILKGHADIYISGHVHNLEQHKPVGGVNFFIIGASGRGNVPVDASDPDTIFAKEAYGFGVLEANDHTLTIRILGEDGKQLHEATFHK